MHRVLLKSSAKNISWTSPFTNIFSTSGMADALFTIAGKTSVSGFIVMSVFNLLATLKVNHHIIIKTSYLDFNFSFV